jgi:hypothetical protein
MGIMTIEDRAQIKKRHMKENSREFLDRLKSEWMSGSAIIFQADSNKEDHQAISKWILGLLDQEAMSEDEELIVSFAYHSLNFDVPFKATASERAELLQRVRMKINDSSRK